MPDDTRTRAIAVLVALTCRSTDGGPPCSACVRAAEAAVDALIAAGLLGPGPSNLDRLAAWAMADQPRRKFDMESTGYGEFIVTAGYFGVVRRTAEIDADPQEAAARVLARLASEQTDG